MSQTSPTPNQKMVTELKVSAHLMLLDPGLFCIFHSPGAPVPDPATGLPGVRISRAPTTAPESLSISTFNADGWLGGEGNAALVRVSDQAAQVLVTIYQASNSAIEAPKLQVLRLSEAQASRQAPGQPVLAAPAPALPAPAAQPAAAAPPAKLEVAAHVQRRGDLLTRLGEWMGERGSQSWIEGFAISPSRFVQPADIEYQAVLGKGWLSPWSEGGSYCGSRGMALPILGLRVRLKGEAAERYDVRVSASFTDGSSVGPVDGTQTAESSELAPLEAFMVEIVPLDGADAGTVDAADVADASEPVVARGAKVRPQPEMPPAPKPEPVRAVGLKREAARPPEKPVPKAAPARTATSARPGSRSGPVGKAGKARR